MPPLVAGFEACLTSLHLSDREGAAALGRRVGIRRAHRIPARILLEHPPSGMTLRCCIKRKHCKHPPEQRPPATSPLPAPLVPTGSPQGAPGAHASWPRAVPLPAQSRDGSTGSSRPMSRRRRRLPAAPQPSRLRSPPPAARPRTADVAARRAAREPQRSRPAQARTLRRFFTIHLTCTTAMAAACLSSSSRLQRACALPSIVTCCWSLSSSCCSCCCSSLRLPSLKL